MTNPDDELEKLKPAERLQLLKVLWTGSVLPELRWSRIRH